MNLAVFYAIIGVIVIISALTLISSLRSVRPVVRILKWVNVGILSISIFIVAINGFEQSIPITISLLLNIVIIVLLALTIVNILYLVMLLIHKLHPKLMI
jgi:hypothetical protein